MPQVDAGSTRQLCPDSEVDVTKLREERASLLSWKLSKGTRDEYEKDFSVFSDWCEKAGFVALPATPETVSLFITAQLALPYKVSTVERRLSSIRYMHRSQGYSSPATHESRDLCVCARRQRKEKKQGKKALEVRDLVRMSLKLGKSNKAIRDRAILVFGFASGLRRSELADLDLADIHLMRKGIAIHLRWSKTDQDGQGRTFGVFAGKRASTDPVRTMRAWLKVRGTAPGPLFTRMLRGKNVDESTLDRMLGTGIALIVKNAMARIGLDPLRYSAHSLRAGLATTAAECGASDREIMRATGHKNVRVMQEYVRHARAFAPRNPIAGAL